MQQRSPSANRPEASARAWDEARLRAIIREGDYCTLVEVAEAVGRELAKKELATSQIRNVFGEVRRLQNRYDPNRLLMLRPKLAYMGARVKGGDSLREVLTAAIQEVFAENPDERTQRERFQRLADFFEAILAYHKAHGGRD